MKRIAILGIAAMLAVSSALAQTGREIAQKVKDRPDGDTRQSEMTMKLINKRGSVRERKLLSYSIDVGKGKKDRKTIMFFLYPGDVKGTGFLTWDYDEMGKDDDKWLYLPAMKKTRRISGSSAKKDYFMGSDFTYYDMGMRIRTSIWARRRSMDTSAGSWSPPPKIVEMSSVRRSLGFAKIATSP